VFFFDDYSQEFKDSLNGNSHALLIFELAISFKPGTKLLGTRLDLEVKSNACRFVLHGQCITAAENPIKLFTWRERKAVLDRVVSTSELIGRDLVNDGGYLEKFIGHDILLKRKEGEGSWSGKILSSFGSSGKFKVSLSLPATVFDSPVKLSDFELTVRFKKDYLI